MSSFPTLTMLPARGSTQKATQMITKKLLQRTPRNSLSKAKAKKGGPGYNHHWSLMPFRVMSNGGTDLATSLHHPFPLPRVEAKSNDAESNGV